MEIRNLESFVVTAELGSFTKAAKTLGYSQSTISFQIRQLEEELKRPLFERVNHTVNLTPTGRQVLIQAHQILKLTKDLVHNPQEHTAPRGHVRIVMADSLAQWLFARHYKAFHQCFPDISLKVTAASTEEMFRLLNQNEADFVYTLDKHIYNPSYVIVSEKPVEAHFVAAADNPLCRKQSLSLAELCTQPFLLTEKGMSYRKLLEEALAAQSLYIQPFLETGDAFLICRLIAEGLGISYLPDYVTQEACDRGILKRLSVESFHLDIWLQLLHHRNKWITPEMKLAADFVSGENSLSLP